MAEARKKILCIEDDRETAALIAEELVERGYEVSIAHDGREGLAAILRQMPDLVLSDISMPVMSGFVRPSFVGPRLLYGAIVTLPGGEALIAPVEITPPPASLWFGTLLLGVLKFG